MKILFFITFFAFCSIQYAQTVINREVLVEGRIHLTEEISIPKINKGFTLWLPESSTINGLVVFLHGRRDTINYDTIINHALSNQLAIMYATTDNRFEFFFDDDKMLEVENYIHEVLSSYNIPDKNMLYCGMSLEGTRVLKLAMFGQGEHSKHKLKPKAIAICDAPIDMVRFHKIMVKAKELKFTDITANEGTWVSGYLEKSLGGSPKESLGTYINYSPYYFDEKGGVNLKFFENISIRAYTEPDVNWWIETRRKDYYSMNSIDLAGLINELRIMGNEQADLIITQNKGYYPDGTRHPHNWSIVDEKELIDWFAELITNE